MAGHAGTGSPHFAAFFSASLKFGSWALHPGRAHVFEQAFLAAFATKAAFAVAAKARSAVEQVGAVDPHRAGLDLAGHVQRQVDVVRPHAGSQPVTGVVRQFHGLGRGAEGQRDQHRAKDLLLHGSSRRVQPRDQGRLVEQSLFGQLDVRLEHVPALAHARLHPAVHRLPLRLVHDGAHVDGLVERIADAHVAHAVLELADELLGDVFLHQQARTGTADLALVEPDRIDHALDCSVQIGIFEHDEGRLAAQFERELLAGCRRSAAAKCGRHRSSR